MPAYEKERGEAVEIVRGYVRGEIEEERLFQLVKSLEAGSIHQLFETLELGSLEVLNLDFQEEDLAWPLRDFLAGSLPLESLRRRIRRLSQIFTACEHQASDVFRWDLAEALNLMSLVLDPGAPLAPQRIQGYLQPILSSLDRSRLVPFTCVVARMLHDLDALHFTTLTLNDFSMPGICNLPWSDLALLYDAPAICDPRGDSIPEADLAPVWFIPLSVTTRRFYQEGLPARLGQYDDEAEAEWMHPRNCRIPDLQRVCPSLPLNRYRPTYLVDPHGFAEIILDVEELSREELTFAIQLFSLYNGARAATLEGEPVELLPSIPGVDC